MVEAKLHERILKVRKPIALAGAALTILFVVYKLVLQLPVLESLGSTNSFILLDRIVYYLFVIGLVAIVGGILGYVIGPGPERGLGKGDPGAAIRTSGNFSPGVVGGDFKIEITQQLVQQSEVKVKKEWRPLGHLRFMVSGDESIGRKVLSRHLLHALVTTFSDRKYVKFVSIIYRSVEKSKTDSPVTFNVLSQQVQFLSNVEKSLNLSTSDDAIAREAFLNEHNTLLERLLAEGKVGLKFNFDNDYTPLRFEYDGQTNWMQIVQLIDEMETDPARYPDKLTSTSEALWLLASLSRSAIASVGDMNFIRENFALWKMMIDAMDGHVSPAAIRVNVNDFEEWDYSCPRLEEEVQRFKTRSLARSA